ncbi:STAS domain-containing protein [Nannocystis punicea]|uniref:PAS domain-containing protein n=1 Tax=Nannocystis punicea TaxID=2995304 RepID=A0ABY7H2Z0_9BACT|nr:STAS domain-containing protein [Nannocystis poenicansa]WAS93562.1 PAS domain-containing protein [Nannocystis poenicansa]
MNDTSASTPPESDSEIQALRRRVAELEQTVAALEQERDVFKHVVHHAPAFISRLTPDGRTIYANATCERLVGKTNKQIAGLNLLPILYPADLYPAVEEYLKIAAEGGDVSDYELTIQSHTGERRTLAWNSYHRFGVDGTLQEVVSFGVDITERKREENERRRLQEEIIAVQAATLAELSTPLIPISGKIVAMPLIGSIDAARAQRIIDTLLSGISEARASTAILDITGVAVVDTQVADALLRAARSVRLLGAEVILTGIRPDVAQTLVNLGTNLEGIVTRATLQSGIAFAMQQG